MPTLSSLPSLYIMGKLEWEISLLMTVTVAFFAHRLQYSLKLRTQKFEMITHNKFI